MATSEEDLVIAEAERLTRRADLERRAPEAARAIDAFLGWSLGVVARRHFCTACDRDVDPSLGAHCASGRIVKGVPPNVTCLHCWLEYSEDVCDGNHAGARHVGRARRMTPEAEEIEALILADDYEAAERAQDARRRSLS